MVRDSSGLAHYANSGVELVLRATTDMEQAGYITKPTLNAIESTLPFDNAIIYSILHEPIYCQG